MMTNLVAVSDRLGQPVITAHDVTFDTLNSLSVYW